MRDNERDRRGWAMNGAIEEIEKEGRKGRSGFAVVRVSFKV